MAIDLPRFDMDGLRRRVSNIELPDRPDINLPDVKMPDLDLRRPDLSGARSAVGGGVDALGHRLDDLGKEMRQIRVVRGPEPRVGPAAGIALLGGIGLGMAVMYFLDPREGPARRDQIKERLTSLMAGAGGRNKDEWWESDSQDAYGSETDRAADLSTHGISGTGFGDSASDFGGSTTDFGGSTALGGSTSDFGGSATDFGDSTPGLGDATAELDDSTSGETAGSDYAGTRR